MQTKNFRLFNYIFFILITAIIVSCNIERKIAKNYVKNKVKSPVLLFFPSEIIKSNLKTELILSNDSSAFLDQDSIIKANDLYLQYIDDSIFINMLKKSMIDELKLYGITVYLPEQIDELIARPDTAYVLNMAQMQIEEYIHEETMEEYIDYSYYSYNVKLNAVNLNSWFELSKSKVTPEIFPVLYSSYIIFDDLDGHFTEPSFFGGSVNFRYKIDSLKVADIYKLADLAGKKYAINLYDYLLNIYVQDKLPKGQVPNFYYHYNRRVKSLQTFYDDAFIEMEPQN